MLLAAVILYAQAPMAAEPVGGAPENLGWAYDPFGNDLFSGAHADVGSLAVVSADHIGAHEAAPVSAVDDSDVAVAREIPADTRIGAGDLNELWGGRLANTDAVDSEPFFSGGTQALAAAEEAPRAGAAPAAVGKDRGVYQGGTQLTSRVSEFDGNAGELFSVYMRPRPKVIVSDKPEPKPVAAVANPGLDSVPVLSRAKSEAVIAHAEPVSLPPSMPRATATATLLTSKVSRVQRLDIEPGMLRNVQ